MPENQTFVGTGANPDGPDLPLSFGAELIGHPGALAVYSSMSNEEKQQVVQYAQSGKTGEEALHCISQTVAQLAQGNKRFFLQQ